MQAPAPDNRPDIAAAFSSAAYWEARYRAGGHSGAGSHGRLAAFKADFVNAFVALNRIGRVIEFGCGDGRQLSLFDIPDYTGVDVSPTVLGQCRARFPDRHFLDHAGLAALPPAELTLSLDVVFHLVEDAVFEAYMRDLFAFATDYVIVYASDRDSSTADRHVRHRHVSAHVARTQPHWSLLARVPNRYPFHPRFPNDTSFADFMVFGQGQRGCRLAIPDRS